MNQLYIIVLVGPLVIHIFFSLLAWTFDQTKTESNTSSLDVSFLDAFIMIGFILINALVKWMIFMDLNQSFYTGAIIIGVVSPFLSSLFMFDSYFDENRCLDCSVSEVFTTTVAVAPLMEYCIIIILLAASGILT